MADSMGLPVVGDKLRYIGGVSDDQVQWGSNDDPRDVLVEGQVYTVQRREVHSWHTKVWLEGHPDMKFNSIHFKEAQRPA